MPGHFRLTPSPAGAGQKKILRNTSMARGFTLIEVMVALMVIAIGLAAVLTTMSASINNAAGLQERTFAHWVAMNQIAKIQLNGNKPPSTKRGSEEMAGHEWYWSIELVKTSDETGTLKFADVSVKVNQDDETPIVTLRSMVSK